MREAMLYDRLEEGRVRCRLCAHGCRIAPGQCGLCGVRENREGMLYSLVYGRLIAQHVDPIEKKPLFHFYPGSEAFSVATVGCNLGCVFCQNADISQLPRSKDKSAIAGQYVAPEALVEAARRSGSRSIAYTYTEPTVFFEYAHDVARLAQAAGLANVWVSNGYMSADMLDVACPTDGPGIISAANIDLKAFRDDFYRTQCGARLQPVLDNLVTLKQRGVWLEVTTLVIPGLNDSDEELSQAAAFVRDALGADTPWHVSRFHPTYHMLDRAPTPVSTVLRARDVGQRAGLRYVYVGNVPGSGGEDTACPACGQVVVARSGYTILRTHLHRGEDDHVGACGYCGAPIAGWF